QQLCAPMLDVYLARGRLPAEPPNHNTADGRPATKAAAVARLGRMLAADESEFDETDAIAIAEAAAQSQATLLAAAITQVVAQVASRPEQVILSGHGDFLATAALCKARIDAPLVRLSQQLDLSLARVGPAHALAVLARESVEQ
ncbi:MAG: hypothetical protein WEH44_06125, partial [Pirellulaceae bacterium]